MLTHPESRRILREVIRETQRKHPFRDQEDFNRHFDYIHWNPVKHGHVARVADWPYSTFHRYVRAGVYPESWCGGESPTVDAEEFGEIL